MITITKVVVLRPTGQYLIKLTHFTMAVIILSSQSHEMRKIIKSKKTEKTEKRCPNSKFKKIKNVKMTKNVILKK